MNTRRLIPVSLMALGLLLVSCSAATNPTPTQTPLAPMPSETMPPMNSPTPAPGATVTLPPAPSDTLAPVSTGTVDITIQNFSFSPPSITIKAGTAVRWTNQDGATHSVTSDTGVWDSGGIAQGASYTRVFDTAGTFAYHCGIHPSMKGTIIVTS